MYKGCARMGPQPNTLLRGSLRSAHSHSRITFSLTSQKFGNMDLNVLFLLFSATSSWMFCTVSPAPTGQAPTGQAAPGDAPPGQAPTAAPGTPRHRVRTKRCSCASFLDKECVYFCHLDIIWVNTPERVVSYGLGNAPRTKRSAPVSTATDLQPRCKCLSESDGTCRSFCLVEKPLRHDAAIRSVDECTEKQCKLKPRPDAGVQRTRRSDTTRPSPAALSAVLRTRLLLEKWRARQRHRTRTREGETTAS